MQMIDRTDFFHTLSTRLSESRALALLGARQVGKTTLSRAYAQKHNCPYFDLEDPEAVQALTEPRAVFQDLLRQGRTIIIDEVQRRPDLFPMLRNLIDQEARDAQFLLLGSASPLMLQQSSESLAGRLGLLQMCGLTLPEVTDPKEMSTSKLWLRGGFPRAYLASSDTAAFRWLRDYLSLVIERDLPQLGLSVATPVMQRFWRILAHYHAQTWNASDPARTLGLSQPTVSRYLDFLTGLQLIRQLAPWHENLNKRQVKAPKIYVRDSGLLHYLWGVTTHEQLWTNPKSGLSWEGFALEQVLQIAQPDEAYFWATHAGAELDLLMFKHGLRIGVEFKRMDAPRVTPSMLTAIADLKLDALYVVYSGERRYTLVHSGATAPIEAIPLFQLKTMRPDWGLDDTSTKLQTP